ncbi:4Fe-4S binding protein [Kosmotoga pacifica]|nr:4Fe-4S binding protein [Kosmotoga pacifica]
MRRFFLIALVIFFAFMLFADSFPSDLEFNIPGNQQQSQVQKPSYWRHDLLWKTLAVGSLSAIGIWISLRKAFKYRKILIIVSIAILGFLFGGVLCPISTVQNVLFKYETAYLLMFLIPIVVSLIFGRVYCGYVCPFGGMQDLLYINKYSKKVPDKADKLFKYLKYIILAIAVIAALSTGRVYSDLTPFKSLFTFDLAVTGIIITVVFAILSIFIYRPFCKYFCPYGALMAIASKFSIFKVKKNDSCVDCNLCLKKCPMNAMEAPGKISGECIVCGECCHACPKNSLTIKSGGD